MPVPLGFGLKMFSAYKPQLSMSSSIIHQQTIRWKKVASKIAHHVEYLFIVCGFHSGTGVTKLNCVLN